MVKKSIIPTIATVFLIVAIIGSACCLFVPSIIKWLNKPVLYTPNNEERISLDDRTINMPPGVKVISVESRKDGLWDVVTRQRIVGEDMDDTDVLIMSEYSKGYRKVTFHESK